MVIDEKKAEPERVQNGPRFDDPAGRESRELPGDVGQDIDCVGHDEEERIQRVPGERQHDLPEKGEVSIKEIEARFASDLVGADSDDAKIGGDGDGVVRGGVDSDALILSRASRRRSITAENLSFFIAPKSVHPLVSSPDSTTSCSSISEK